VISETFRSDTRMNRQDFNSDKLNCLLGEIAKFRKEIFSFIMSVRPSVRLSAWNISVLTGRIFIKFHIRVFFENLPKEFKFH
jgi:hypothetical protein